jgi:choline dehydrogenase
MEADFIIVGAGSAGCVLANRLTQSGEHKVLLLEAGKSDTSPWIHIPIGYAKQFASPTHNWMYNTAPGETVKRSVIQPRGKVLGGTSSINGMVYIRGQREDYDHWAQLGNRGWSYDDVLPYFKSAENFERGGDDFHGSGGPLHVSDPRETYPITEAFLTAARGAGLAGNADFNGAVQEGFGYYQWTIRNGRRHSAAVGYLKPARGRANLTIATNAHATRLLFEGRRVTGVEYRQGGQTVKATARREVIVAGGAYNSPQLLQLSGLGPAELLRSFGIQPVADLKSVGENLRDHYNASLIYHVAQSATANELGNHLHRRALAGMQYLLGRPGLVGMGVAYCGGFVRIEPHAASPDLQVMLMLFSADKPGPTPHEFPGVTVVGTLLRPESSGHVRIVSADPFAAPEIQPNYLAAEKDRTVLTGAVRLLRDIMSQPAIAPFVVSEYSPGLATQSDDEIFDFLCDKGRSSYHPVSTCRMGNDAEAVVDPQLRVRGVEALRVIDASVMPSIPSGNTNAPTIMIAEKGADMILADAKAARAA